jgi:hypothetical protein
MLNSLNTRIDNHYNNGRKSTDGVYDDKMRAADINFIEALLGDDPINLKRAMQTRFGYSETSFFDDITSGQNEYSAELFSTLLKVTGGGDVLKGKITEGMVDTDGEEGISAQEAMDSNNYKILTANILGLKDAKVSKEFFKQYAVKNYQDSFEYGYSKKPPVEGGGGGGDDTKLDFYSRGKGVKLYNNQILTGESAESFYTAIRDGVTFEEKDPISGKSTVYSYQFVNGEGGWYENFEEGDTPESVQYIGSGSDLASRFTTDQRFRNLQTTVEERVDLEGVKGARETRLEGDYSKAMRSIDIDTLDLDDNDVASSLTKFLPPVRSKNNAKGYVFLTTQAPALPLGSYQGRSRGDFGKESVTLYQSASKGEKGSFKGPDGNFIKPVVINGKIVEIKTGGSLERRRKAIEDIDKLFDNEELKNILLDKPRL